MRCMCSRMGRIVLGWRVGLVRLSRGRRWCGFGWRVLWVVEYLGGIGWVSRGFGVEPLGDGLRGPFRAGREPALVATSLGHRPPPHKIHAYTESWGCAA